MYLLKLWYRAYLVGVGVLMWYVQVMTIICFLLLFPPKTTMWLSFQILYPKIIDWKSNTLFFFFLIISINTTSFSHIPSFPVTTVMPIITPLAQISGIQIPGLARGIDIIAGSLDCVLEMFIEGASDTRSMWYMGSDKMDKNEYGGGNTNNKLIRSRCGWEGTISG